MTPADAARGSESPKVAPDPLLGKVIDGRYTILGLLGKGGMGSVYRAHQASLERAVALKVLAAAPDRARDAEFQRRFFIEAATAAKLKHPNTITIFDYGSDDVGGTRYYFIAMELVEGQTLSRAMKNEPFTPLRAVQIALQVARSTREAHKAGIVHRDLKPGNIMLVRHGDDDEHERDFVKVLDFGLAKPFFDAGDSKDPNLTRAGTFLGSPRYVAPEQIEGKKVDPRADVYSLGCVLYRMLAGHVPFDGEAPLEVMLKHLNEPVPPLPDGVAPPLLERLVVDCLAKSADDRPQSMDDVMARLKLVRAQLGDGFGGALSLSDERHTPDGGSRDEPSEPPPPPEPRPQTLSGPTPLTLGQVAIEDAPPDHILRRRPAPKRSPLLFAVGVGFGLVAFVLALLFLDDDLRARARAFVEPPPPPPSLPTPPVDAPTRRARVRVKTKPSDVAVLERPAGAPPVLLGTTPLTLDWRLADGAPRTLVLRKTGYAEAQATVELPAGVADDPVLIDVDVTLVKAR